MTDRARKITELQGVTNVAMSDKVVVSTNSAGVWSTRNMDIGILAQNMSSKYLDLPGSNTFQNTATLASNYTANVAFLVLPVNTHFSHIKIVAKDTSTGDYIKATLNIVTDGISNTNVNTSLIGVGNNQINVVGNLVSNAVTLYFNRASAATSNVTFNYSVTVL